MSKVRFDISLSLDGFMAGPDQSVENPVGVGGMAVFEWMFPLAAFAVLQGREGGEVNASTPVVEERFEGVGAYIMGRNMFGGGHGPWPEDPPWNGWWGDDPPYHTPVFVLTHHARGPQPMAGGTTFNFVTDGVESALEQARVAAGDKDVVIAGGAATVRQYLAAGHVDELNISLTPSVLGSGERPFEDLPDLRLEQVRVVEAPGVTHLQYRLPDDQTARGTPLRSNCADVAELVDAHGSGPCERKLVEVQVLSSASRAACRQSAAGGFFVSATPLQAPWQSLQRLH